MTRKEPLKTQYIILNKTPFMESSVIVSGISPDFGKIDFLIRGDRRVSGKKSPEVDLFRVMDVQYYEKPTSIFTPVVFENIRNFDEIGGQPEKLLGLIELSKAILRNSHYHIPCFNLYNAFLKHIERTVKEEFTQSFFIRMVYLYENGILELSGNAELDEGQQRAMKAISIMLDYSLGKRDKIGLNLTESYMIELEAYFNRKLEEADIVF